MDSRESNQEILDAIQTFSTHVDKRFDDLEGRVTRIESTMATKDYVDQRLRATETRMVSKDYLDEKLGVLRGDIVELVRGEDKKVIALVQILRKKNVLSEQDIQELLRMAPFPQMI